MTSDTRATGQGDPHAEFTAGVDVGSTYTKAALLDTDGELLATSMTSTGFRLDEAARRAVDQAANALGREGDEAAYVAATGYGRSQVSFRDVQATDLTAQSRGTRWFFPNTRTVLDVGGQTMKAMRLDEDAKVLSFRLNDRCAAGTGAFLEKTARYLGYSVEHIGELVERSHEPVHISGVCAVFAESEVINHLTTGAQAEDIMHGAMRSLVEKSVRLMKRVQMEPAFTLVGGILRFPTMVSVLEEHLGAEANIPPEPLPQYSAAIGAAVLARQRLEKVRRAESNEIPFRAEDHTAA